MSDTHAVTMAGNLATVDYKELVIQQLLARFGEPNLPRVYLNPGDLYFIIHETANTNASAGAEMHAIFVYNGGGSANVSFHFTVDKHGVWQMIPLDNIGYHAADGADNRQTDLGAFRGIAIEVCVNDPIGSTGWLATKRNLVALITAVCMGDDRIDYGNTVISRFSPKRDYPHIAVSDPGSDQHHCPDRMLNEGLINAHDGSGILRDAFVLSYAEANKVEPPKSIYAPVVGLPFDLHSATGVQNLNGLDCLMISFEVEALKNVVPRAYAGQHAKPCGPTIKPREKRLVKAQFKKPESQGGKPVEWFILSDGARVRATSFTPRVIVKTR